ncbi:MAG: DUF998 domain-containing protein [Candidatus Lokiarchaeota archaeon]|nr:DUF998 domain-containing protein [Candidatus Lokiarchaeota archaeon]
MSIRKSINKARAKFYNKVTNYNFIKKSSIIVIAVYLTLLLIAVIIAAIWGPYGYTIWTRMISDLGGSRYTPVPILFDIACIFAGIMTIPLTFYIENLFAPLPKRKNLREQHFSRMRFRLGSNAFFFSLMGNLGYIFVGIFSEDRNNPLLDFASYHDVFSFFSFTGFALGAFFIGWIIVLYDTKIPKLFGIYGIIGPPIMLFAFLFTMEALWEWILLFSILLWIIPLVFMIFRKSELRPK